MTDSRVRTASDDGPATAAADSAVPPDGGSHWPAYYAATVDRPAWGTTIDAAERFDEEDRAAAAAPAEPRLAVDLGCGAGRDTRELLRRGWRVLAVDQEAAAIEALTAATPEADRPRLEGVVADLASFELPPCDLVVASVSLQLLPEPDYAAVFARITRALRVGGRFAGLLYGDRDEAASDPDCTCPSPEAVRGYLAAFEMESWHEREEDGHMALGDAHHIHLMEVVARRR